MSRLRVLDGFFILILFGLTYAFYKVIAPFLLDIFLAVIFVNIFRGVYLFFCRRMKPGAASLITVLMLFILVVSLLSFFGIVFSTEAVGGLRDLVEAWPQFKEEVLSWEIEGLIEDIPFADQLLLTDGTLDISGLLDKAFSAFSGVVATFIKNSFTSISTAILHFILVIFIMYFLFTQGPKLLDTVRELIPLDAQNTEELIREVGNMTRATVVSTLLIGILEGVYGGLIFVIFGIPSPALWAIIIAIVSMIPLIGSNLIIVPAGILELLSGQYAAGVIIILLGLGGIAVSQNILKPKLLGGRSGLHPLIVLLSTLGGIAWLGLIGFLVGPMVAALFIVIWRQFAKKYKVDREEESEKPAEKVSEETVEGEP